MNDFRLLIGGGLEHGADTIDIINPATGAAFTRSPAASADQIGRAVAAATGAFPAWRATPFEARKQTVRAIMEAIRTHREDFANLLTLEQGKPLAAARGEVDTTLDFMHYFLGLDLPVEIIADEPERLVELHRAALGPVAAIVPWNFPLLLIAFKLPPALMAGNTIVIKPAPTTPLSALLLGRLVAELVPPGAVNVVAGDDRVGPLLTGDTRIAKISFTGSTATGHRVMESAAASLARVTLELGGNDPAIILPGSDPAAIAPGIFGFAFGNSGQICRAIKRVYLPTDMLEPFCAAITPLCAGAVVGDGMTEGVQFGPIQNAAQYTRIKALFAKAADDGRVLEGGGPVEGPGYFFRPTVVAGLRHSHPLVQEEQFGPLLPIVTYDDVDEAVRLANDSPYGLSASVWGPDPEQTRAVADRIDAGTVWLNKHGDRLPNFPIAGAKQSGIGAELGQVGLLEYTQIRVVNQARVAA